MRREGMRRRKWTRPSSGAQLCEQLDRPAEFAPLLFVPMGVSHLRASRPLALSERGASRRNWRGAERSPSNCWPACTRQARFYLGSSLPPALCRTVYGSLRSRASAPYRGDLSADPAALLTYLALRWRVLGLLDQARVAVDEALSEARRSARPYAYSGARFRELDRLAHRPFSPTLWHMPRNSGSMRPSTGFRIIWVGHCISRTIAVALGQAQRRPCAAHARAGGSCYRRRRWYADAAHMACRGPRHARAAERRTEMSRRGSADHRGHRRALAEAELYRVRGRSAGRRRRSIRGRAAIVRPSPLPSGRAQSSSSCGHRSASPGSGATRASARKPVTAQSDLQLVHRRFRCAGPEGREGAAG